MPGLATFTLDPLGANGAESPKRLRYHTRTDNVGGGGR
jgi:hypothetical protein